MLMKNSNITGWKDIFTFTLIQTLKNKAFIISTVILLVIVMVSMPIMSIITNGKKSDVNSESPVKKVYVNNKTTLSGIDFHDLLKGENMSHIAFEDMKEDYDVVSARIADKEKDSIILTIKDNKDNYSLDFAKVSKGPISDSSLKVLQDSMVKQFQVCKMKAADIKAEQLSIINTEVKTKVSTADINGVEVVKEDTSISNNEYWFIYALMFTLMMINVMASSHIASSIVTEKSNRVIEYLLTSVKPLAIMVGKIIAMLTAVLLQIISLVVVFIISSKVSQVLFNSKGESILSKYLPQNIFHNLNIINIVLCLLLFVLGMIFYATLAGLAGATVSRIEEMSDGLMLFTFSSLIGIYIGIFAATMLMSKGVNGFVIFSFLFPLSAPFILPGAILIGKASFLIGGAAILILGLFVVLLFKFVAKVYETLILHNGNKIKIKEMIKISKMV